MSAKQYGILGIVGVASYLAANLALHILDPDLSIVETTISEYALGDYDWLSQGGTIAMGVGVAAVALGLRATLSPGKRVTAAWVLLLICGLGFIISGIFITDPAGTTEATTSGTLHELAGTVSMLTVLVSVWILRGVFTRDAAYRSFAVVQMWFAIAVTGAMALLLALGEDRLGLSQRILVVAVASWLLVLALRIQTTQTPTPASAV